MFCPVELKDLNSKYKTNENESLLIRTSSSDDYLCFRMDGIKSSKRHLKDVISNDEFSNSLKNAINTVYYLNRNHTHPINGNLFCCAFSVSDEVSFIINKGDNYYDNRIFKMGTVLSSTLSSTMTIQFELMSRDRNKNGDKKKRYPDVMAFDSRPLILNEIHDVKEYIKYRWLLACRNAACKVLRLNSDLSKDEIYNGELNNNLTLLLEQINCHGLIDDYHKAVESFYLFVPNSDRKFASIKINKENINDSLVALDNFVLSLGAITKQS